MTVKWDKRNKWSKMLVSLRHKLSSEGGRTVTQLRMAESIGYSSGTISKWARGDREPEVAVKVLLTLLKEDPSFIEVIGRIVKEIEGKGLASD